MLKQLLKVLPLFLRVDLLIPLALIVAYLILIYIVRGTIPTTDELISTFSVLYARFGLEIIFVSAFLESLVIVTYFVPGSFALALGVIFARTGETELVSVIAVALIGATLGYQLDYLLGSYGFGEIFKKIGYQNLLDTAKSKLNRFGKRGLIIGFVHSNLGSLVSFAAGATGYPWWRFTLICFFATLFWATLWAIIIYSLGEIFLDLLKKYSFLLFVLSAALLVLVNLWKGKKE
jgi:membrane protein DedA with SNARE-associated domain